MPHDHVLRYSINELRTIQSKPCVCVSRQTRRRLFYHGLFVNHISVQISSASQRSTYAGSSDEHIRLPRVLRSLPRLSRHFHQPNVCLTFGLLNIRSLLHKVDEILKLQHDKSIDILLITETWHDEDSVCLRRLRQSGFTVVDKPRERIRTDTMSVNHGGVAIVSSGVRISRLDIGIDASTFEFITANVCTGSFSATLLLVYRTGPVTSLFFLELSSALELLAISSGHILIAGDFNIHIERPNEPSSRQLLELFDSYGFDCCVHSPTHALGGTLDIVFCRTAFGSLDVHIEDPGLSDHYLLCWSLPIRKPTPIYVSVSYRPWKQLNITDLKASIYDSPLCKSTAWAELDVNELANLFDSTLMDIVNRLVPLRNKSIPKRTSDPWFDQECREAKRAVRRAENCFRKSRYSLVARDCLIEWKIAVRNYRQLLKEKKETFWKGKVLSEIASPKNLWQSIDRIMARDQQAPPNWLTAKDFLNYMNEKISLILQEVNLSRSTSPVTPDPSCDCEFNSFDEVSSDIVVKTVLSLPNKSSPRDVLPITFMKECIYLLAPFLSHLFSMSLSTGIFPNDWKLSVISPIIKKPGLDPSDPASFRPIAKLPLSSKVLERIVSAQLRDYLSSNDIFPPQQSAYMKYHSTETSLLSVTSDVFLSLDKGQLCLLALLDISAAFDSINHEILCQRLHYSFGLSGSALAWINSFVCNRHHYVRVGSTCSSKERSLCGVPQGSVMGPLLFILYISEVTKIIQKHNFDVHLYADDVQIYGSCLPSSTDLLSARLSICLDEVMEWFKSNHLLLNESKTEFVWLYSNRCRLAAPSAPIRIGSSWKTPVSSARCLGVHIDSELSFRGHITKRAASCFAMLRQIRSIQSSLPRPIMKTVVSSLVIPRLDYCLSLLHGVPACHLKRLQSVLNTAARLIYGSSRYCAITPLLKELKWLPIQQRIDLRLCILAFSCYHQLAPTYLSSNVHSISSVSGRSHLRSADSACLVVPGVRRPTLGGRSFVVTAARAWNSLPVHIRNASNLPEFKKLVKDHFYQQSFS